MARKDKGSRTESRAPLIAPPSVGAALSALRQSEGLSLEALARQSGVSKSMLSQIERDKTNPTVAVVWRLAQALGVEVAELLRGEARGAHHGISLVPSSQTPNLRTADARCELRILGPVELAGRFEWYEITLQPGGALRSEAHPPGSREHLTVLNGLVSVTSGDRGLHVKPGETARYAADVPHAIINEGKSKAVALLVVLHPRS
ncbi:MAG TPA: XRE family transcriptional regulator [Steroidobacteraceae bacterium]|nr:XRE family transcriptional regulator [Steroidobacteraceae bacterium]